MPWPLTCLDACVKGSGGLDCICPGPNPPPSAPYLCPSVSIRGSLPSQKEIDKISPSVSLAVSPTMQTDPENDPRILDALSRGDSIALDWIWDAYASRLLAFATALLCSRHDAEEILQNVFVKIARNDSRLAAARSLKAYLFTMTRNEALSLARRRGRIEIAVDPAEFGLIPATPAAPPPPEEAEAAARHLAALPEKQRAVIALKIFEDLTFDQIAASLKISINTAASRYRYGIDKLRNRLHGGSK